MAIDLAPGGVLIRGDIWLAGRYARGVASEQFAFDTLIQDLTVRRGGARVFRDRFTWQGPRDRDAAAWHFGGAPACGSLFATVSAEKRFFRSLPSIDCAVFPTCWEDMCLRCHGSSEAVCAAVVQTALRIASVMTGNSADEPWL